MDAGTTGATPNDADSLGELRRFSTIHLYGAGTGNRCVLSPGPNSPT